ncbi:Hypothetical protein CINCED_3A012341 [Cinara cedri]|uniref:Uncharacterized protein n=1 Tax=Cinara cedri TaxID=506608 RepID=A0A5E4MGE9_9HEMI|nr:Hypothetical protein CINCED_3A012341 [Cinara cedri]
MRRPDEPRDEQNRPVFRDPARTRILSPPRDNNANNISNVYRRGAYRRVRVILPGAAGRGSRAPITARSFGSTMARAAAAAAITAIIVNIVAGTGRHYYAPAGDRRDRMAYRRRSLFRRPGPLSRRGRSSLRGFSRRRAAGRLQKAFAHAAAPTRVYYAAGLGAGRRHLSRYRYGKRALAFWTSP